MEIPTFRPTWDEFQDFATYMARVRATCGANAVGLVRIVPPQQWRDATTAHSNAIDPSMAIRSPVEQCVTPVASVKGASRVKSVVVTTHATVAKFREWCDKNERSAHSYLSKVDRDKPAQLFAAFWQHLHDGRAAMCVTARRFAHPLKVLTHRARAVMAPTQRDHCSRPIWTCGI